MGHGGPCCTQNPRDTGMLAPCTHLYAEVVKILYTPCMVRGLPLRCENRKLWLGCRCCRQVLMKASSSRFKVGDSASGGLSPYTLPAKARNPMSGCRSHGFGP